MLPVLRSEEGYAERAWATWLPVAEAYRNCLRIARLRAGRLPGTHQGEGPMREGVVRRLASEGAREVEE